MLMYEDNSTSIYAISIVTIMSIVTILVGCVWCRKKVPKNELLGLEGMVKIKNPDDNNVNCASSVVSIDPKAATLGNNSHHDMDVRRSSNAPHRSLPDIPTLDAVGDTNSELYATVGDKVLDKPQGRSPTSAVKQASVSQHSSLSQADDVSSPYARVKSPHAYDKVRHAEHAYAQVNQAGPSNVTHSTIKEGVASSPNQLSSTSPHHSSNESLRESRDEVSDIPAASAIAGRIAASQDLPYMTPPLVQPPQQNFSGDSQDSSKGYTSISVREPLANIIAQTNKQNAHMRRRGISDPHYATVSDDSDEMYAAIDDPNNPVDVYTSGSETYAQIQPLAGTSLTVSVEINPTPRFSQEIPAVPSQRLSTISTSQLPPPPPPIQTTEATPEAARQGPNIHSRQASSSSCTSSVGNLGSPKPEKRQANSPLPPPPTPKGSVQSQNSSTSNLTSSTPSGRSSVASVIEVKETNGASNDTKAAKKVSTDESSKKKTSPSKDLEGMYAKVMKKNKLSNLPSQNSSPVMSRKQHDEDRNSTVFLSNPDVSNDVPDYVVKSAASSPDKASIKSAKAKLDNNYETIDKNRRVRSSAYDQKDPGYETIPGDKGLITNNGEAVKLRSSVGSIMQSSTSTSYTNEILSEPGYESLPDTRNIVANRNSQDPGYEVVPDSNNKLLKARHAVHRTSSEYDPNYEVLRPTASEKGSSDDGYAKVLETNTLLTSSQTPNDMIDGYSSIDPNKRANLIVEYSEVGTKKNIIKNHDYASIKETTTQQVSKHINNNNDDDEGSDIYSSIPSTDATAYHYNYSTINTPNTLLTQNSPGGYSSISETRTTPSTDSTNSPDNMPTVGDYQPHRKQKYESLTESESDPNYESVKFVNSKENPYERLHNERSPEPPPPLSTNDSITTGIEDILKPTAPSSFSSKSPSDNLEVGDYFQV